MSRARPGRLAEGIALVALTVVTGLALWWVATGVHESGKGTGDVEGTSDTPRDGGSVSSTLDDPGSGASTGAGRREPSGAPPANSATTSLDESDAAFRATALLLDEASDVPLRRLRVHGRVVDEQGEPVAGTKVWLLPSDDNRRRLGITNYRFGNTLPWDSLAHTLSDAIGRFELTNVEVARASGDRPEVRADKPRGKTPTIIVEQAGFVTATETVPGSGWDVSMGELTLWTAGVVTGRVVDERDEPVPEAILRIPFTGPYDPESSPPWNLARSLADRRTDADGRFRIDTLKTGTYELQVHADRTRWTFQELTTTQGEQLDLGDIVLLDGALLGGRLVNEAGEGIPGATVRAIPSSRSDDSVRDGFDWIMLTMGSTYADRPGSYDRRASSDRDGRFAFDDLDPVPHDLFVRAERYEVMAFTDQATGRSDLQFVLAPEALIAIRVVDESTELPIVEASMSAARLIWANSYSDLPLEPALQVFTGPEAAERLGLEGMGQGLLVAGPAGFVANRITVSAPGRTSLHLDLPGLQAGEIHEQTVHLAEEVPDPLGGLSGVTLDASGDPLPHVELTAHPNYKLRVAQRTTTSDAQGRFAFEGMKPGSWYLNAKRAGYLPTTKAGMTLDADATLQDVEVHLEPGARLEGTVFTVEGTPARLHAVEIRFGKDKKPAHSVLTDASGHYRFDALRPGELRLSAHPGALEEIDVVRGELNSQDLQLQRPPKLSGTVRDAAGRPVAAKIYLYPHDKTSGTKSETTSDEQGAYLFEGLGPISGRLYANQVGARSAVLDVQLNWSDSEERDIEFGGGRVGGWVFRAGTTQAVAGVKVRATLQLDDTKTQLSPRPFWTIAKTVDQGRYDFDRLLPGRYELRVMRGDWVRKTPTPISLDIQDTPIQQDLLVEPCAQLIVYVSTQETDLGRKLNLQLTRLDKEDALRTTTIQPQGETTVESTPAGTWSYTVTRSKYSWRVEEDDPVYATGEVQLRSGEVTRETIVLVAPDE
jgi:protocatechuate 3,4-dioxygenase beta subunit